MSALQPGWGAEGEKPGRFGLVFIGIWTFYLLRPLRDGWDARGTVMGWVGMVAVIAFTVWYLTVFARRRIEMRQGVLHIEWISSLLSLGVGVTLSIIICIAVGQTGTATAVYLAVVCAMTLPNPWAIPFALANNIAFFLAGNIVPAWKSDSGLLLASMAATLAVWGIQQMMMRNVELVAAQDQNRVLAVSEERNRFARDLHDILGHSLTVITVKAELANRLIDVDPARARTELADLERLSRDALADVRHAVEGYRDLSLAGELVRARTALEAAQIAAELPNSTDEVPSDRRELFAWTLREGVTNVIRHSNARHCRVRLEPGEIEVSDDGVGDHEPSSGHGLLGLRERAAAAGGTVITRSLQPGFSLMVTMPS